MMDLLDFRAVTAESVGGVFGVQGDPLVFVDLLNFQQARIRCSDCPKHPGLRYYAVVPVLCISQARTL
jgi:hypothetical protein